MSMEGMVGDAPRCDAMRWAKSSPPRDSRRLAGWLAGWLECDLRLLSWRERCSERLNARLQNWHLYLFSFSFSLSGGAVPLVEALRLVAGDAMGSCEAPATADMLLSSCAGCGWGLRAISSFWGRRKKQRDGRQPAVRGD